MKRIYTVLAALSLILTASCEKYLYDDTSIKESISSLEERVKALENLNAEVAALKKIVEDQISIVEYHQEEGRYRLLLSDGNELVLYTADNDVRFMTVIKVDGVSYWAYYYNGKVTSLQLNGKGVKVESAVPEIRNGEDGYLEISVDQGNTWVKTDAKLGTGLFSNIEKNEESVIFTLADGVTQYAVPLLIESEVELVAFSGTQYFSAGETKTVAIQMIGIEGYTITEKPEGWKVVLTDGELKVTAPAEGTGAESGYVKILGVGQETKIAKVFVTLGSSPCLVTISSTLQVNIKPNPTSCFYGACTMDEFDAAAIAQELSGVLPMMSRKPFTASELTVPLADLVNGDLVDGETYVVWALPVTGDERVETDVIYQAVSSIGVNVEVKNITFENASISVRVKGTDTYYLIPMEGEMTLDDVITDLNGAFWATFNRYKHTSMFRGTLLDIIDDSKAGETYEFLVLPVRFGEYLRQEAETFTVKLNPYTTGGPSSVTLEEGTVDYKNFSAKINGDSNTYKVVSAVFASDEYSSKGYADDATLITYLTTLQADEYAAGYTLKKSGLENGKTYWVVAAGVDETGAMGAPARLSITTKAVLYSDVVISIGDIGLTMNSADVPLLATGGNVAKYRYMFLSSFDGGYWYNTYLNDDTTAYNDLIYGTADYIEVMASNVAGGLAFNDLVFGIDYLLCVIGYDSEGKVTNMAKTEIKPTVGKVVACDDEKWAATKPDVLTSISGSSINLNIIFPTGACTEFIVTMMSSEEYSANVPTAARLKTDYVVSHNNALTFDDNLENYSPDWYIGSDKPYLLITWKDEDGWYEPLVYNTATGTVLN